MKNKGLHMVAFILLVIGGLNWGLVGLFEFDLVATVLGGQDSLLAKIVYILVALSAIYLVATHKHDCRTCTSNSAPSTGGSMGA